MLSYKDCPLYHQYRHVPTCRACHSNREGRRGRIVWDAEASVYLGCCRDADCRGSISQVCADLIASGDSVRDVASALGVSEQTVRKAVR